MPTATQQRKQLRTQDLDDATEPNILIERRARVIRFTWPCGAELDVSKSKLETVLAALDFKPPAKTRHISIQFTVIARSLYSRNGARHDVTFTLEGNDTVRAYSAYEEESALLPLKDLRAAIRL